MLPGLRMTEVVVVEEGTGEEEAVVEEVMEVTEEAVTVEVAMAEEVVAMEVVDTGVEEEVVGMVAVATEPVAEATVTPAGTVVSTWVRP